MAGILSKIFGGGETGPDLTAAQKPFLWIDIEKPGTSKRLANYIVTGDDKSSLLILDQLLKPGFTGYDYKLTRTTSEDLTLCLRSMRGEPHQIARLAAVCCYIDKNQYGGYHKYLNIKENNEPSPNCMELCSLLIRATGKETEAKPTPSYQDFKEALSHLGGKDSDILVFFTGRYQNLNTWILDGEFLIDKLFDEPVEIHAEARERCNAVGLENLIETYSKFNGRVDPKFIPLLISHLSHGSAKVRTQARLALMEQDVATTEAVLVECLSAGQVKVRTEAVIALGELGSDTGKAALAARAEVEKNDALKMILDRYLTDQTGDISTAPEAGYIDVYGKAVVPPPFEPLVEDKSAPLTDGDFKQLLVLAEQQNEKIAARNEEYRKQGHKYRDNDTVNRAQAKIYFDYLNTGKIPDAVAKSEQPYRFVYDFDTRIFKPWVKEMMDRIPMKRAVAIALRVSHTFDNVMSPWRQPLHSERVRLALLADELDVRQVLHECRQLNIPIDKRYVGNDLTSVEATEAELVFIAMTQYYRPYNFKSLGNVLIDQTAALIAELPPVGKDGQRTQRAIEFLKELPSLPQAAANPIMLAALDDRVTLRNAAAPLFKDLPGIDEKLIESLNDKRQGTRTHAANYLAHRGYAPALPAIEKRLKKEKSELVRAAMISAVAALGGSTDVFLSSSALEKEASALVAKLPNDKLDWLQMNMAPELKWKDGKACSPDVLDGWLRLATKLKTPGDVPLFGLYLDQIEPASATALGDWILQSWIAYDSYRTPMDKQRADARKQAEDYHNDPNGPSYYKEMTLDRLTELLFSYHEESFPNSGSASKGILSLARFATDQSFASNIAKYLKDFGKRVSQAKCLLEVLAVQGSKESVQVLVATATRFKQVTVRERAEELLAVLAEERGWTREELAERSVPSGGIDEAGVMELPCGQPAKTYIATLGDDLSLTFTNPDGRVVKGLPAGKDDETKASKKLLSETKKTLKTVEKQQSTRFFEAMVSGRTWTLENWQTDILGHPVLKRLAQRIIWRGLDSNGEQCGTFRPTPEGELVDAAGDDVDLVAMTGLAILHSTHMDTAGLEEWREHLDDFEVAPLFQQIAENAYVLAKEDADKTEITDRTGWLTDTFTLRSAATKAGFDRGPVEDGASFSTYIKAFNGIGMNCVLEFTGSYVPEDNLPAAVRSMHFVSNVKGQWDKLPLNTVPAILLAEMHASLLAMTKTAAFDPEWQKKGLW